MSGYDTLREAMERLYAEHGITSVLVEGGAELHRSFMAEGLWDRMRIERSDKPTNGSVKAPTLPSDIRIESMTKIDNHDIINITK